MSEFDPRATHHELKSWAPVFADVLLGRKTFELRRNDRDFRVGDSLTLVEVEPRERELRETGRRIDARVVALLERRADAIGRDAGPPWLAGLSPGWCVLGIEIEKAEED